MNEFELIKKYFYRNNHRNDVLVGNGDDCAILKPSSNASLAMSIDTLVSGIHFDHNFTPENIGYKSLAVNLSDLAAAGAKPAWAMLSLTLPSIDEEFLSGFSTGFFELLDRYSMNLIGGDITKGPLSITVQVSGYVQNPLLRSNAKPGDLIYLTHEVGDAVLALHYLQNKLSLDTEDAEKILPRLFRPTPRVQEGIALNNIATSAIDISDGLYGDLQHILSASNAGAKIYSDKIPVSTILNKQSIDSRRAIALHCGDSYELCFTVPRNVLLPTLPCKVTCIGEITNEHGICLLDENDNRILVSGNSFQHF